MLLTFSVSGYRSLYDLSLPLSGLNIVTGPNGSGKSNLYRVLRLVSNLADGQMNRAFALEGGFESALWAGARRKGPVRMLMGFTGDDFSYAIDLGLPIDSEFPTDPEVKREWIWHGPVMEARSLCLRRRNSLIETRNKRGKWTESTMPIAGTASVLSELLDPENTPEVIYLRESLRNWRFYDSFDTGPESALRQPQPGCFTPVLSSTGQDIAAAIMTILAIGDSQRLRDLFSLAFPECELSVSVAYGYSLSVTQRGMLRRLKATELSDGTLRFICLLAALLTPRPPELMVLNEPETSLHPDMIPALAELIIGYAAHHQLIVVSHSNALIERLADCSYSQFFPLVKSVGRTQVANQQPGSLEFRTQWPKR